MILTEKIETLNKQEFQTLFFHMLQVATTKYGISFFPKGFITGKNTTQKYVFENESEKKLKQQNKNSDDIYNDIIANEFLAGYSEQDNIYDTI